MQLREDGEDIVILGSLALPDFKICPALGSTCMLDLDEEERSHYLPR